MTRLRATPTAAVPFGAVRRSPTRDPVGASGLAEPRSSSPGPGSELPAREAYSPPGPTYIQ